MPKPRVVAVLVAIAALTTIVAAVEPEFSAERLRAHVTFLADDLLEGREAGTRGYDIAANYIASQFALLGVKPGGQNGGYFVMRPTIFDELRQGEDMVPHAFDRLIPRRQLLAQRYEGFWRAADTFKDRAELEDMYHRGQCPWMLWDPHHNGKAPLTVSELVPKQPTAADPALAG